MSMAAVFYGIGAIVVYGLALGAAGYIALFLYFLFIDGRFGAIFCRKGERRLSIAAWHRTRLVGLGNDPEDTRHSADDWVVCERPFYLSYDLGEKRMFILAGTLKGPRHSILKGEHP